jgi:hypothetical protein
MRSKFGLPYLSAAQTKEPITSSESLSNPAGWHKLRALTSFVKQFTSLQSDRIPVFS